MDTSQYRNFIEEEFTKAMAHSLMVSLPSKSVVDLFTAYVISTLQLTKSGIAKGGRGLDEQYVRDCIPLFMEYLKSHSREEELVTERYLPGRPYAKNFETTVGLTNE